MPSGRKITISKNRTPAIQISNIGLGKQKAVYVMVVNKNIKYEYGGSPIAYIGTTKQGINRAAQSAANHAQQILDIHGVNSFSVYLVTCKSRQGVKTWHKLERAMLLSFRSEFGQVPLCNQHGRRISEKDEFEYFTRSRIRDIILSFSHS